MIRIVVPKTYEMVAPYFSGADSRRYLYLTAQDDDRLLAILQFKYKGDVATGYKIELVDPKTSDAVLDGLIRTMLFQMADAGCSACRFYAVPKRLKAYFLKHGFHEKDGYLEHTDYVDEFFKPCPGCSHG